MKSIDFAGRAIAAFVVIAGVFMRQSDLIIIGLLAWIAVQLEEHRLEKVK